MALDRVIRKQASRQSEGESLIPDGTREQIMNRVQERLTNEPSLKGLDTAEARRVASDLAWTFLEEELDEQFPHLALTAQDKRLILERLLQGMFGLGLLEAYINDPNVSEIMVNGRDRIFVEQNQRLSLLRNDRGEPLAFTSDKELLRVIQRIVAPLNRKVDESDPLVDARLPNGSRVSVVLPPIALDGPSVTIRKFPAEPYTMVDLIRFGTLPEGAAELLSRLVKARYNIVISGGTGSGKTTFLNALSMYIPPSERLVTIEDAAELKLARAENIVRMETRPPNVEGKGAVTIRDLVRQALRMRPDRIIVGEVRGPEALDMLQAMNTGHDGSLTTGHANSTVDVLSRLETMVLTGSADLPLAAIRAQIVSAVDFIIHIARLRDGRRCVVQVTELLQLEGGHIVTQDILALRPGDHGVQQLAPTGSAIRRTEKLIAAGMEVSDGTLGFHH